MFGLLSLCFWFCIYNLFILVMVDRMNELDPVEEYENENSIGISLVEPISDDDDGGIENN